jgi:hypothetical protein
MPAEEVTDDAEPVVEPEPESDPEPEKKPVTVRRRRKKASN